MKQKQLFAIGGVLALGLLVFWGWRTHLPEDAVSEDTSNPGISSQHTSAAAEAGETADTKANTTLEQNQTGVVTTQVPAKESWTKPEKSIFWDQAPKQKQAIDFFTKLAKMKFPAVEKPIYVGINEQGFDQYQYRSSDDANVTQWKRSNEVVIEEAILQNGDKIIRKAPEVDNPLSSVSYESKANKTYHRTTYRANGSIESLRIDQNEQTTIYYYDEQGRVSDMYSGPTPK